MQGGHKGRGGGRGAPQTATPVGASSMIRARWCHGYSEGPKGADDKHAEATGRGAGVQHTHGKCKKGRRILRRPIRWSGAWYGIPRSSLTAALGVQGSILGRRAAACADRPVGGGGVCVCVCLEAHGWRREAGNRATEQCSSSRSSSSSSVVVVDDETRRVAPSRCLRGGSESAAGDGTDLCHARPLTASDDGDTATVEYYLEVSMWERGLGVVAAVSSSFGGGGGGAAVAGKYSALVNNSPSIQHTHTRTHAHTHTHIHIHARPGMGSQGSQATVSVHGSTSEREIPPLW